MIRKNLLIFKLNLPEDSLQEQYSAFMRKFNPALERCPSCGAKGQCSIFAYYERGIVEINDGRISFRTIRILRVICSCRHTHAVIPDFIIPYRRCSLPFILYILHLYFSHAMTKEKRQPLILTIDEAQYLNTAILNDLKMLMNYDYDSINCFTLILCGESYLNNTLRKPVHEALRQRITVHYEFQGLSDEEVPAYVRHKIHFAGGSDQIINEAAMSALNSMSQNNPRVIDNIMNDALTISMQSGKHVIDADIILAAVNHQSFA